MTGRCVRLVYHSRHEKLRRGRFAWHTVEPGIVRRALFQGAFMSGARGGGDTLGGSLSTLVLTTVLGSTWILGPSYEQQTVSAEAWIEFLTNHCGSVRAFPISKRTVASIAAA
ncbi:hypothetical protein BV20DRAFT_967594 [Pilatotrama ljubarskyi]|nr:hypothetical protein BV20DRAFT_967594 [Pilatotrama ljubarskyi]